MAAEHRLTRLSAEGSEATAELRQALRGARSTGPDAAQRAEMEARLGALLGGAAGGGAGSGAAGAPGAGSAPAPSAGAGAAGGGLPLGAALAGGAGLLAVLAVMALRSAPMSAPTYTAPSAVVAQAAPVEVSPPAAEAPSPQDAPEAEAVAPPAPASTEVARSAPLPAPARPQAPAENVVPSPAGATSVAGGPTADAAPSDDFAMLERAQRLVASAPAQALELANQHAQRHPRTTFAQEREVIVIDALARLGRKGEARARGRAFLERAPQSPYRRRIEAAVGEL